MPNISNELVFILLTFGLLVLPRTLQRFRLPAPLTCTALDMAAALLLGANRDDGTLALMVTRGISSLFLFAGLEIDLADMRRGAGALLAHVDNERQ